MLVRIFNCLLILLLVSGWAVAKPNPGLKFIQNKNQWPSFVDFAAKVRGGSMLVSAGQFQYSFLDYRKIEELHHHGHAQGKELSTDNPFNDVIDGQTILTTFLGSNKKTHPIPFGKYSEYYNYFLGNDQAKWASDVPAFEGLLYPNLYAGITLKLYSEGDNLKYDFVVAPEGNANQIQLAYQGSDHIYLSNGNLHIKTPLAELIEMKPVAYQWMEGNKVSVACEYELIGGNVSFCFPDGYNPCYELVIDPLLIFSTYSGSTADNWGSTATPGERGTLYSSGVTTTVNAGGFFPATPGAFQTNNGGLYDISILKYDSAGRQLLYASFLGGSQSESPHSLVVNNNNELLVLGTTSSANFPTSTSAFDRTYNGGISESNVIPYNQGSDIFVAKINKTGNQLLASSYFGGSQNDGLNPTNSPLVRNYGDQLRGDIIADANGSIYVSTVTSSSDFPAANSFGLTYKGGNTDALILKLNNDLSQIVWASFLGGSNADASHTIKIDKDGNLFVGGGSISSDFPTTLGSYQPALAGSVDGWIAKIKGDGSSILNSTFTGTFNFNQVYFIDLDRDGNVYAYGQTEGSFPITAGKYNNPNSGQFLQKFNNSLSSLIFSTVFGSGIGAPNISPTAFLVNDCNNIYLSGWGGIVNSSQGFWQTTTVGMTVTPDAFQKTTSGSDFYFIVLSADASQLLYASYLGGNSSRTHVDGGTSRFDKGGIVYHAVCAGCAAFNVTNGSTSDFPTTPNAWSRTNGSRNCNNAAFKFDLSTLKARIQTNSIKLDQPGLTKVCFPDPIVFQNRSIGGQQFFWSFGDGEKLTKTDTSAITYKYKSIGTYPVKLKITDAGTCQGKDSTTVQIQVVPVLGFAGDDQVMCFNAGTQLTAGGGVNYQWKNKTNSFTSAQPSPFVNPTESDTYFVTITDSNGCVKKDTVNVRVVPGIDLKFNAERINFDCFNLPSLKVVSETDSKEEVFFDFGDGTTSDMPSVVHQYNKGGNYTVRLIGKKESCVYEKRIDVTIDSLRIPNVITPGVVDNFNDTFKIQYGNTQTRQGIKVSVAIYNRWGGLVYESKDYKDDWTGNELAAGVYFYEVAVEGITTCRSWLQVIK